jgi:hypothetical protein
MRTAVPGDSISANGRGATEALRICHQADCSRLRNPFQPYGDINPVAHEVAVVLLDNVAKMNADAEFDALVGRDLGVALDHRPLDFDGAVHRVDDAAEFNDAAVPGALDERP